ncbi:uncharacterized protein LOC106663791 isoform X2 [Cimex lectularius]|uniref:Uncharacterized protein n=1 Tax=Cimex lectularius TaxID=79782 RepID=A0A8I6TCP6_CIMLE|nr:uncharacterized protein LOC106663791 isoform X2 [Cimex lectularius]
MPFQHEEKMNLQNIGFPRTQCVNYLTPENERMDWREDRTDWQHRMQNLSMSCSMVCLIILGASALVGAFGIAKHQISAVLVTGVMYLLAGTFALFTLMIIHYKRKSIISPIDCTSGGRDGAIGIGPAKLTSKLILHYLPGRSYISGWSLDLGWAALGMCILTASLWILLARVMRFTPFTSLIT